MIAARLATMGKGQPKKSNASIDAFLPDQVEAGELLNVSRITVQRARKVMNEGTAEKVMATTGSVAAAVKYIVKKATSAEIRRGSRSDETVLGQLLKGIGVGRDAVLEILPDMNRNVVDQQLANLKTSGEYLAIVSRCSSGRRGR